MSAPNGRCPTGLTEPVREQRRHSVPRLLSNCMGLVAQAKELTTASDGQALLSGFVPVMFYAAVWVVDRVRRGPAIDEGW